MPAVCRRLGSTGKNPFAPDFLPPKDFGGSWPKPSPPVALLVVDSRGFGFAGAPAEESEDNQATCTMKASQNTDSSAATRRTAAAFLCFGPLLLWLFFLGRLEAATIEGTKIYVTPTLLSPAGGTLVTATLSGGARFYTGTTPPTFRIRLTQGTTVLNVLEPVSVSQTRLTFRFPALKTGYYGFQVQVKPAATWVVVHESSPRFFRVGSDLRPSPSQVFEATDGGVMINPSAFLETGQFTASGMMSGKVEMPVDLGCAPVNLEYVRDYCDWAGWFCSEGGVIFNLEFGFGGTATFEYHIPFEVTFDFPKPVYRGQTVRFYASSVRYPGTGETLNVAHKFDFSTKHRLMVNVPWDSLPAFDVTFEQLHDKLVVSGQVPLFSGWAESFGPWDIFGPFDDGDAEFGGAGMTLGGHAAWDTYRARSEDVAGGPHQVWTGTRPLTELWKHYGDQIAFLRYAPIPVVQPAAVILSEAGVKFYQDFNLDSFASDMIEVMPPDPFVEVTIPQDAPLGVTRVQQTISFPYTVYLYSQCLYKLGAGFTFEIEDIIGRTELGSWNLRDSIAAPSYWDQFSGTAQVYVDLPVTVSLRDNWRAEFLATSQAGADIAVANYTPEEAAQERARIKALALRKPELPPLVSTKWHGEIPVRPESQFALLLASTPTVGGTITADPSPLGGGYAAGKAVTLRAQPTSGYRFAEWSGAATGSANPTAVTMNDLKSVTAKFETELPPVALVNPSFEADTFAKWPGYRDANGPITGWTAEAGMGINPVAPFGVDDSPFADNGAVPDGRQVAFLQQDGALKQVVQGLAAGATYRVEYWENGRHSWYQGANDGAVLEVRMGTTVILPAHEVPPLHAYILRQSEPFVAAGPGMELAFVKVGPAGLDRTALIDNVRVICCTVPTTPPRLNAALRQGTLTLSWDAAATGFTLESTPSLRPPVEWTPVAGVANNQATLSVLGASRFYRLHR